MKSLIPLAHVSPSWAGMHDLFGSIHIRLTEIHEHFDRMDLGETPFPQDTNDLLNGSSLREQVPNILS